MNTARAHSGGRPDVTVVIPTYRRRTRLAFALEALAEQTIRQERFEVLVVRAPGEDDDVGDDFGELPVRSLEASAKGPASQRNHGWRNAAAPLVAFTDDDCRPAPDWLERMLAAAGRDSEIVQGRTVPDPDERHLLHGRARSMEVEEPSPWYPTCNLAYPKPLLERLGGFDEDFPEAWGEDTDLGLRAADDGASLTYAEGAVVWHAVHARGLPAALREAWRRDAIPMVIARHPEQRRHLYRGVFVRRSHANLLLAVAGVVAARRTHLVSLAATVPYLRQKISPEKRKLRKLHRLAPRVAFHLPARIALDAAEVVATARAAARHRVVVL